MQKIVNGEVITTIFENEKIRIEKISSFGNASPDGFWYCQDEDEWVSVTKGKAQLQFEDGFADICKDEHTYIPAYKKHRVTYTSDNAEWLCVFVKK